jgi:DNA topoisomerase VI subunit B
MSEAARGRYAPTLERVAFTTSRTSEFCTRRELERQTGVSAGAWPLYVCKELIDNAADGAEEARIAPSVDIEVGSDRITVSDNGLGIPAETVKRLLDLSSRTSSRSHWIAPTRGAQGQALSTMFVMAHALDPGCGCAVIIEAQGLAHRIALHVDRLSGEPKLMRQVSSGSVKSGTKVTVEWPESACTILEEANDEFLPLALAYVLANPHLDLTLRSPAGQFSSAAVDPLWGKWRSCDPTSPHWYNAETFGRLMKAQISRDRETDRRRPLREFLEQFDGLSGTTKRRNVLEAVGLQRASLADLLHDDELDKAAAMALLMALQAQVRPVKPVRLGVIGEANLRHRMVGEWSGQAFAYARAMGFDSGDFPYVVEGAFAWKPQSGGRQLIAGANFASTPSLSFSLNTWETGETLLERRYAGAEEPICVFLHVAHPRLMPTDLGKTRIPLPWPVARDLRRVIEKITDAWERQRRREIKSANAELKRQDALDRQRKVTIKKSVYKHLPAVYAKWAGDIGVVCRQLFYGLRPLVLADTGLNELDGPYIEYGLIPDFISEHPDLCGSWTVFYDDRGHLIEPHTEKSVGLGTRNVRAYCRLWGRPMISGFTLSPPSVSTYGPSCRYGAIQHCEKEGFNDLFEAAKLRDRFDLCLCSTKGTTVTAARELFEKAGCHDVLIFALHDFDYNGFEILATMQRDTRRYRFKQPPRIIDIGLRLADVRRLNLQAEPVSYGKRKIETLRKNLRLNGATEEEIAFLIDGKQRVELNALSTPQLIEMIETALIKHGVKKVVPNTETLAEVYRKEMEYRKAQKAVEQAIGKARDEIGEIVIPDDLEDRVEAYLKDNPTSSWDMAIRAIAGDEPIRGNRSRSLVGKPRRPRRKG